MDITRAGGYAAEMYGLKSNKVKAQDNFTACMKQRSRIPASAGWGGDSVSISREASALYNHRKATEKACGGIMINWNGFSDLIDTRSPQERMKIAEQVEAALINNGITWDSAKYIIIKVDEDGLFRIMGEVDGKNANETSEMLNSKMLDSVPVESESWNTLLQLVQANTDKRSASGHL